MSNMSYCRFRNTLKDLKECIDVLESYDEDITSEEEREKGCPECQY